LQVKNQFNSPHCQCSDLTTKVEMSPGFMINKYLLLIIA
jgi:hypothetical protein